MDLHGYGISLFLGALSTIKLSMGALGIGLVLGLCGAAMALSRFRVLQVVSDGVTTVIRGIPELLFVLGVFLGSSVVINGAAAFIGYRDYIEINAFWAGVIALGVVFGAYATEVFRGAILAVAPRQIQAAQAFGMTSFMRFRRIILPQMWRIALPGLGNLFLVLLKNTALLSVIGVRELMRNAVFAVGVTKSPFLFYCTATAFYLFLTFVSTVGITFLEKRAARGMSA